MDNTNIETTDNALNVGKQSVLDKFLLKDSTFIILVALACSAIFSGTHMYIQYGTGAFNEIHIVQFLKEGMDTGDFSAATGFATGFLLARILEAPLVGLLDIGGALLTGVGIGIPAMMLIVGLNTPLDNFFLSIVCGAIIGIMIGGLIMLIRKFLPNGVSASGTGIMMGAGNATGRYLGPLVIISAIQFGIPTGIGAFIGAGIFYKLDRPISGGAILGAMILGGILG